MVHHPRMTTPDTQFKLRLPTALKSKLEGDADAAGRSLSAEIVQRLEDSGRDAQMADAFLRSQLLNFQLATELVKFKPRMIPMVSRLMNMLFVDNDQIRDKIFGWADEGDEIAAMARSTLLNDLPGIIEGVQKTLSELREEDDAERPTDI